MSKIEIVQGLNDSEIKLEAVQTSKKLQSELHNENEMLNRENQRLSLSNEALNREICDLQSRLSQEKEKVSRLEPLSQNQRNQIDQLDQKLLNIKVLAGVLGAGCAIGWLIAFDLGFLNVMSMRLSILFSGQ